MIMQKVGPDEKDHFIISLQIIYWLNYLLIIKLLFEINACSIFWYEVLYAMPYVPVSELFPDQLEIEIIIFVRGKRGNTFQNDVNDAYSILANNQYFFIVSVIINRNQK